MPILEAVRLPPQIWRFGLALFALTFLAPYAALFLHYRVLRDLGPEAAGWMQAAIGISLAVRTILGSAHPVFLTPNVNRGGTPEAAHAVGERLPEDLVLSDRRRPAAPVAVSRRRGPSVVLVSSFCQGPDPSFCSFWSEIVTLLAGTYQSLVLALDRLGYHVTQNMAAQGSDDPRRSSGHSPVWHLGRSAGRLVRPALPVHFDDAVPATSASGCGCRCGRRSWRLYLVAILLVAGVVGRNDSRRRLAQLFVLRSGVYMALVGGLALFLTRADQTGSRSCSENCPVGHWRWPDVTPERTAWPAAIQPGRLGAPIRKLSQVRRRGGAQLDPFSLPSRTT